MMDNNELKRLAEAVEACTSMEVADEAAWMRRTTGEKVLELFEELENIKADRKACWEEFKVQGRLLDQLKAENEVLRKDAERWRFIAHEWPKVKLVENGEWFNSCFLEREIDAAMSKEPKA